MADVIVIGAGLAGLACTRALVAAGVDVELHEASDEVGGRVRTDVVDGMQLDRGFQVLNPAYPELRRVADLEALDLRPFVPGALLRLDGRLHRVADPRRHPQWALSTARAPVGSLLERLALLRLTARATRRPVAQLLQRPETTTRDELWSAGVSDRLVDRFLRPLLSGVVLEDELTTSSRYFDVLWRSFARGTQALPARGMGALPQQLASALPDGVLRLGSTVTRLSSTPTVVATDPVTAADLLGLPEPRVRASTTDYHMAPVPPYREPAIALDGDRSGPVVTSVVLTNVAPSYAPGRHLVASTVLGTSTTETEVRDHLARLYGCSTTEWEHVARYQLPVSLPAADPPMGDLRSPVRRGDGVYACGDWVDTPSQQGALVSGRRAAEAVLQDLRGR